MEVSLLSALFLLLEETTQILLHQLLSALSRNAPKGNISLLSTGLFPTPSIQRTKAREMVQREDDMNEIVQLVGKDALAETDKITLETAKLLREDYLAQNAFTAYNKFCPFCKSVWMMRNIIHVYNLANQAVERGTGADGQKINNTLIKHRMGDLFYCLVSKKFEDPTEGEPALVAKFSKLYEDLSTGFRNFEDETR